MSERITYIVRHGNSHLYKIGITKNFKDRLAALQSGNPVELIPIFLIRSTNAERQLHKLLGAKIVHGEWYLIPELDTKPKKILESWLVKCEISPEKIVQENEHFLAQSRQPKKRKRVRDYSFLLANNTTLNHVQAAEILGIEPLTVFIHLNSGRLIGDYKTGMVNTQSIIKHQRKPVPNYDNIVYVLEIEDGLTDKERSHTNNSALPKSGLTDRERDILQRRLKLEGLNSIGADYGLSKQRINAIAYAAIKRMKRLEQSAEQNLKSL